VIAEDMARLSRTKSGAEPRRLPDHSTRCTCIRVRHGTPSERSMWEARDRESFKERRHGTPPIRRTHIQRNGEGNDSPERQGVFGQTWHAIREGSRTPYVTKATQSMRLRVRHGTPPEEASGQMCHLVNAAHPTGTGKPWLASKTTTAYCVPFDLFRRSRSAFRCWRWAFHSSTSWRSKRISL